MDLSTTDGTPVGSRPPVLKNSFNWEDWISFHRAFAKHAEVWVYIDPNVANPPTLEKPIKPTTPTAAEIVANSIVFDIYKLECEHWKAELDDYRNQKDAIRHVFNSCIETLDPDHHYLVRNVETAHERIQILQTHFKPTKIARSNEIVKLYDEHKATTCPDLDEVDEIEQWLSKWMYIAAMAQKDGILKIDGERLESGFLTACLNIDSMEPWVREMMGKDDKKVSMAEYVASFKDELAFINRCRRLLIDSQRFG